MTAAILTHELRKTFPGQRRLLRRSGPAGPRPSTGCR